MDSNDVSNQTAWQLYWTAHSRAASILLPAAILCATFLAYVDTLVLGFVFDDHTLIVANDAVQSWRYFPTYFTSHIWSFRYPHLLANYYRPLFLTWLRLNDQLFGLRPWGWHLTSMLAHLAVTFLVYRLALRLARDAWVAGAAGLIFGLHPVHAEAVADITSIQEPLSTFFIIAALLAFFRSREPGDRHGQPAQEASGQGRPFDKGWLAASLTLTAAALLSKESGMVVPILVAGFAWIYAGGPEREGAAVGFVAGFFDRLRSAVRASFPFWLVFLLYLPLRMWALRGFAHVITPVSLSREIFTIPSVLLFYLRLLVWPSGLSCYYDTPYVPSPGWREFVLPLLVLMAVTVALVLWYLRLRQSAPEQAKAVAFASLWTVVTIVPVLNFRYFQEGEIAHDRYVYLASVGFVVLAGLALRGLIGAGPMLRPAWALAAALLIACVMGYATARQNLFWADDVALNFRAHEIAPHNVSATTSLAAAVAQHGMDGPAMALYQQALALQPKFWRANINLAFLYYAHGNYPQAARYFAMACAADPTDGEQFLYLGMSLMQMGRLNEAEDAVRTALLARPMGSHYHLGLGMVLQREGKFDAAKQEVETELAQDPQNPQARALLEQITRQMQGSVVNPPPKAPSGGLAP